MASAGVAIQIELAASADATPIAETSRREIEYGLTWRYTPARIRRAIAASDSNVVVARSGRQLVGFGVMRYADSSANLDLLGVVPGWRSRGVGGRLVDWLEAVAVAAGVANVFVQVRLRNGRAIRFYRRQGFVPLEQLPGYYGATEGAQLLARQLRPPCSPPTR